MLNQAIVDALYSANYLENYLDCVENLPNDLQRLITRLRELDATSQTYLREIDNNHDILKAEGETNSKKRALVRVQQVLIATQEIGDEKLQVVQNIHDLIENKTRQLDVDFMNLDCGKEQENNDVSMEANAPMSGNSGTSANNGDRQTKRARRTKASESAPEPVQSTDVLVAPENRITNVVGTTNGNQKRNYTANAGKKKKRKARQGNAQNQHREETPPPLEDDLAIDPDEPTYCLCDQISYGEMILCDNDLCPIEWFHFSCVSLSTKPKGKWYCPKCRGERPNIMKPKAQFLKELERYNKEKEEKL